MSSPVTKHIFHQLPPPSGNQHPAANFPGLGCASGASAALSSPVELSDSLRVIELPRTRHSQILDDQSSPSSQVNHSNLKKKRPTPKGPRGRFGCRTCRQRHIKCDETRSVCGNCTKAKRECLWNHELQLNHDPRSFSNSIARPKTASSTSRASAEDSQPACNVSEDRRWRVRIDFPVSPDVLRDASQDASGDYLANVSHCEWIPDQILKFPLEAYFFRFYIEHAGSWLDITSPSQHFALTVPRLAVSNPVLLFACLSYSARSLVPDSSLSEQYMSACIKLLIPLLSDEVFVSTDETLLATLVILRHVEQYAEATDDKGAHLSGAFSLIASQRFLPPHDSLPGAALWTYMRQDIRQALLKRAPPKLKPGHGIQVENFDDGVGESSWADRACYLAALACTFAWGGADEEIDPKYLNHLLQSWETNLPTEYLPYHISGDSIQYLARWHGVAWQFYHLARILMKLYNTERPKDMDLFLFNEQIEVEITGHARMICNIAYSSNDIGCLFNASAIVGFVGSYFRRERDQGQLIDFMIKITRQTNWPTQTDQERLLGIWRTRDHRL